MKAINPPSSTRIRGANLYPIQQLFAGLGITSQEWLYALALLGIRVSMDGKGRCLDNIPIERFWRTIKYEEVYLKTYDTVGEARIALGEYIHWYNHKRRHMGLDNHRPFDVMRGEKQASRWLFSRIDGNVDNCAQLSTSSTIPTTTTASLQDEKKKGGLCSKIAA